MRSRPTRIRTRRREAGAAVAAALIALCAFVAGGCGSETRRSAPPPPRLPAALAADLASHSDDVARLLDASDGCGALDAAKALQRRAIAAINAGRVPARLQEPLSTAANDLVFRIHCVPPPAPAPAAADNEQPPRGHGEDDKGHEKEKKHGGGHGKGRDKHGDGGDE